VSVVLSPLNITISTLLSVLITIFPILPPFGSVCIVCTICMGIALSVYASALWSVPIRYSRISGAGFNGRRVRCDSIVI
jgi:hypothetical protein